MPKAVMISIQPKWCELIASGKKTAEIRKTAPQLKRPFKCYIYQTKGAKENPVVTNDFGHTFHILELGKVIGEFVCDKLTWHGGSDFVVKEDCERAIEGSCVSRSELFAYLGIAPGIAVFDRRCDFYCWHISNLYIYDIPKKLSDFKAYRREHRIITARFQEGDCELVQTFTVLKPIVSAPQSWCYCQELKDAD